VLSVAISRSLEVPFRPSGARSQQAAEKQTLCENSLLTGTLIALFSVPARKRVFSGESWQEIWFAKFFPKICEL
jgi:hypothetical protein